MERSARYWTLPASEAAGLKFVLLRQAIDASLCLTDVTLRL